MTKPMYVVSCYGFPGGKTIVSGDISLEELRCSALQGNADEFESQRNTTESHFRQVHEELIARPAPVVAWAKARHDAKVLLGLESITTEEIEAIFLAAF